MSIFDAMYGTQRRASKDQASRHQREAQVDWQQKFAGHRLEDDLVRLGLLTLPTDASHVMQAWRAEVKLEAGTGTDMDLLKQARDRLMLAVEKGAHERINQLEESSCKACGGSGRIGVGFGRECPTCKGTGTNGPTG